MGVFNHMSHDQYLKYRKMVLISFAIEAGKLLGILNAHYELLQSEGLPIDELVRSLELLRKTVRIERDNLI